MKVLLTSLLAVLTLQMTAQISDDSTLLKIDDKEVSRIEFETIFKKNNRDTIITKADLDEYAELFVNFKLKVGEAESLGMDTMPQFVRELEGYRDQLARPYLVDNSMTDSLVLEAYQRSLIEVKASHILIKLPSDPSPEDTTAAYTKIMSIKKNLMERPDEFGKIARTRSDDPSARTNGGNLGYFSSMQMVYPFENAAYNTPVGEIGGPVRTQYGYHLVKVEDERPARGKVRVAHIMIRVEAEDPADVQESAQNRVNEIYSKIQAGEDFGQLAKKYSDDRTSAGKNGELPAFGAGKMVAEFEDAAFNIPAVNDVTEPIRSPYGWHIIKLLERIEISDFESVEKELRTKISKDSRSYVSRESFIEKRKAEYGFTEDRNQLKIYYKDIDTTYFAGKWSPSEKLKNSKKVIFTLDGNEYTQQDFTDYLVRHMRPSRKASNVHTLVNDAYDNFLNKTVMAYENSQLEKKYPEFKALMGEYRDGILLFDLTDEKVWSRAVKDSAGLAKYYSVNSNQYMWDERAGYDLYKVENEKTGKAVIKMLNKGKNQDEIKAELNAESSLMVSVESGLKEKADVPVLEETAWEPGVSSVISYEGQLMVIQIKEIRPAEVKEFDEARGLITAGYQNLLEEQWVEQLRSAHTITIDKEVLYSIQ